MPLNLSSYSRDVLEDTLGVIKKYQISLRQIGKKASLHERDVSLPPVIRIEYTPSLDTGIVIQYAKVCLASTFPTVEIPDVITCIPNSKLTGGIRVFV